jgi:hypothetical protein
MEVIKMEVSEWFCRLEGKTIKKTFYNPLKEELTLELTNGESYMICIGSGFEDAPMLEFSAL